MDKNNNLYNLTRYILLMIIIKYLLRINIYILINKFNIRISLDNESQIYIRSINNLTNLVDY